LKLTTGSILPPIPVPVTKSDKKNFTSTYKQSFPLFPSASSLSRGETYKPKASHVDSFSIWKRINSSFAFEHPVSEAQRSYCSSSFLRVEPQYDPSHHIVVHNLAYNEQTFRRKNIEREIKKMVDKK